MNALNTQAGMCSNWHAGGSMGTACQPRSQTQWPWLSRRNEPLPHRTDRVAYSRRATEKGGRDRKMRWERICACYKCEEDSRVKAFCFGWVCVVLHWQAFDGSCEENKLSGFAHGLSTLKCCDVAGWWSFDRLQTDLPQASGLLKWVLSTSFGFMSV